MNKTTSLNKIKYWILKTLQLQLFLSIISLPILISWGLPISIASPLGNILFTPFLTIFLFLSSLIFFLELFYIPNIWLIKSLDLLTNVWNYFLSFGSKKWLIAFPAKSMVLLILLPIISIFILQHKKVNSLKNSILCFSLILLISGGYLKVFSTIKNYNQILKINSKELVIICKDNKVNLIDKGALSKATDSWIEFTLIPHLIKEFGWTDIETLQIEKLTPKLIKTINSLLKKMTLKSIYVVTANKTYTKTQFLNELIKNKV